LAALFFYFSGCGQCTKKGKAREMEINITENLVKVLIRQRDIAMSKCAELEAKLLSVGEKLAEFENKEHAEDLFKDKE
jgi:hypothetical protein